MHYNYFQDKVNTITDTKISIWRNVPDKERQVLFEWSLEEIIRKNQAGQDNNDEFQGDHLLQIAEELIDTLFYVYAAVKYKQALERKTQNITYELS